MKNMKKEYEPIQLRVVKFETEDVLSGSPGGPFFGDAEDMQEIGENDQGGINLA